MTSLKRIISLFLLLTLLTLSVNLLQAEASNSTFTVSFEEYKKQSAYFEYEYDAAFDVLDLLNKLRKSEGKSALSMDRELLEQAMHRSLETMVRFDHKRPNGELFYTVGNYLKHSKTPQGENIAGGSSYASPQTVMTGWINSDPHCDNMLNSNWKSVGIGSVSNFWVQLFSQKEASTVTRRDYKTRAEIKEKVIASVNIVELKASSYDINCHEPELIRVYGKNEWTEYPLDKEQFEYSILSGEASIYKHRLQATAAGTIKVKVIHKPSGKSQTLTYNAKMPKNPLICNKSGWNQSNGKYYYCSSGVKEIGWLKVDGKWYYLGSDYIMRTGWVKDNNKWYYMDSSGAMRTGWLKTEGKWYYLDSSGAMKTGWLKTGGKWYYLASNGVMKTGWSKISGNWYYLDSNGAMQTGWLKLASKWYYLDSSGAMKTGWLKTGGKWFFFYGDGSMAVNTKIEGYSIGPDGAMY